MPDAALAAARPYAVLPIEEISRFLNELCVGAPR